METLKSSGVSQASRKVTTDCKNLDIIREILPTHGDKEIILPTIEASKRGVTKGKLSLP